MKRIKLIDIAPFSGQRVKPFDGTRRYLSTGDLKGNSLSFEEVTYDTKPSRADIEVNEGDILFAKMTNTIKALQIDKEHDGIIVSTGFSVHRPIESVLNGDYLLHFLKHDSFQRQKNKLCTGAIQSAISNKGIAKIFLPVTEYEKQAEIANFLNRAENLINERKESIRLLDDFLKSTFWEMFGNPTSNVRDWNITTLESLCSKIVDCPHETPKYIDDDTGYYCIRSNDIQNGIIDLSGIRSVSEQTYIHRISRHEPEVGEVVYTREGGRLGNAARIPENKNICLGQRTMLFIADAGVSNNDYLWSTLNSDFIKEKVKKLSGGGAAPRINISQLKSLKVLSPPLNLQNQFSDIVKRIDRQKMQYQQSLRELEQLYGSLSQKAFNGELNLS